MCKLHRRRRGNRLVVVAAMLASVTMACTIVDTPIVVGPSFQVRVDSWRQSTRGLRVELRYSGNRKVAETGPDGVARFQALTPGFYEVVVQPDAAMRSRALVEVRAKGASVVPLNWPETEPVRARNLEGTLRGSRVERFHVELMSGTKTVETVQANEREEFRFNAAMPAGLYFLRLVEGVIPVAVDPQAKTDRLDVSMVSTSCGLWYVDQSTCWREELTIGRITDGRVVDPADTPIARARVRVSGRAPLSTDSEGKFDALELPEGLYDLEVTGSGFFAARRRLRVAPAGNSASLLVHLTLGGCGTVATIR